MKPRKPIPRISKKRAAANRLYNKLRLEYLEAHPFCQIYIKRFGLDEDEIIAMNGAYKELGPNGFVYYRQVPLATTIHHTKKPKQTYLNAVETWLSACWEQHEWVEKHKNLARDLGLLQNI